MIDKQFQKAFSLVEIIVVVAITSIILIVTMQILSSAIRIESRTLVAQAMYEQVNYLIDYMSKDLRMAARGTLNGAECGLPNMNKFGISGNDTVLGDGVQGNGIAFRDQRNNCMQYVLAPNQDGTSQIGVVRKDWIAGSLAEPAYFLPLTSKDYNVTDFSVIAVPGPNANAQRDEKLTRVMIGLTIESKTYKDVKLRIQTLISTRNRD